MRVAVIGSGIAGMSTAWLLSPSCCVDLYEADERLGGHAWTLPVDAGADPFGIDVGFQVFNDRTYPNLIRFFDHLRIDSTDADMSFSVRIGEQDVEWSGTNLNSVFAQRKNLVNPKFLSMLADVLRMSHDADGLLADPAVAEMTLGELLAREGYGEPFTDWYLIPMGAAIWSTPPGDMLDYPALTFLRFCDNHGLLHVTGKPLWRSVPGGSQRYVEAAARELSGEINRGEPVLSVERVADGVVLRTAKRELTYDAVVFATHPPETLSILGDTATARERKVLGAFRYLPNDIVIHTDASFMPREPRAWASWNWYSHKGELDRDAIVLTYRVRTLQQMPQAAPEVFETLNRDHEPSEGSLLDRFTLDHPMFDRAAIQAQEHLGEIQGVDRIWYAGAWTRYGFHEDGILSGVRVAEALGADVPWGDQLDATRTRVLERP
jgi:predicted NAD/FAD-binding protein